MLFRSKATAEKEYAARYQKTEEQDAATLKTDVGTYKNAVIKFMMDNGGIITPTNATFDAGKKEFIRKSGGGGAETPTGGMGGNYE